MGTTECYSHEHTGQAPSLTISLLPLSSSELHGLFLVRLSNKPGGGPVLSAIFVSLPWHYRATELPNRRYRFYGREYASLEDLVQTLRREKGPLLDTLRTYCPRV